MTAALWLLTIASVLALSYLVCVLLDAVRSRQ